MNAVVVYESMFGNTREIACAVAEGLGGHTRVIPVEQLTDDALTACQLLIVGGPTHRGQEARELKEGSPPWR